MATAPGPPPPDLRFEALAEIAVSATARVDLCRIVEGPQRGALVAVKRLHDDVADDPEFVKMFRDEVWMASSLNHENVVRVLGWGESREGPYFATEFVRGVSLARLQRTVFQTGEMFSERLVVFLASCICKGLQAAHELRSPSGEFLNLVHRDLTPENVLVSFSGDVKITDFGLAKAKRRASRTLTGLVKGAREYMAPEQIEGRPIDRRADIFALGVMLFELFSGQRPWLARSGRDTMRLILEAAPPDLNALRAGIHTVLVSLVSRCLAKDPSSRFQTAAEVDRELTQWLQLHGYHENQDHLARFVRRNAMRQMRWVERAITGEFAQGGGPNLAAAPPVSPAEEAAMNELEAVADWPSVTSITRVEPAKQPESAVRPTDQGWPKIEVSPTGVFSDGMAPAAPPGPGSTVAMDADDADEVSTLIQRPEHKRRAEAKVRAARAALDTSDSLPTIPTVAAVAGIGPSGTSVAAPPAAYQAPAAPASHAAPVAPASHAVPVAPASHAVPVAPASHAVPVAPASHAAPVAPASHAAPVAPASHAAPAEPPGPPTGQAQPRSSLSLTPAGPPPVLNAGSPAAPAPVFPAPPAVPTGVAAGAPAGARRPAVALKGAGAATQSTEAMEAGPPPERRTEAAQAAAPPARSRTSTVPPGARRDPGRASAAVRRQAQAVVDDAGRVAARAASLAERAIQAAERANSAAELARQAATRATAAAEAIVLAQEACELAGAGRLDQARERLALAEQRRQAAKADEGRR